MLVMIKSAPDTPEGKRAVKLARDMAADICLMQNAVCFSQKDRLDGFCGTVYALKEDMDMRGLSESGFEKEIKMIDYDALVDLMIKENGVTGVF
jgi:sulfur relay protein TusB/DsrH